MQEAPGPKSKLPRMSHSAHKEFRRSLCETNRFDRDNTVISIVDWLLYNCAVNKSRDFHIFYNSLKICIRRLYSNIDNNELRLRARYPTAGEVQ